MASFTKSFLWLTVAEFVFYASGYIVHMGAGRILGVEDYGRYTLVITITILVANLIGAGLPLAMGKFLSATKTSSGEARLALVKTFARWQAIFLGVLGIIFFLSAKPLALLLGDETLVPLFQLSSLIIPAYGIDLHYFHYYSGLQYFTIQAWLKTVRALLRISVILLLAYWFHLSGMIAGYILVPLGVFVLAFAIDRILVRPKLLLSKVQGNEEVMQTIIPFRRAMSVAVSAIGFLAIFELLVSFDLYVLKYFIADDTIVGEYGASLTVARIPTFLFYALTIMLLPTLSESEAMRDYMRAKNIVSRVLNGLFIAIVPIIVVFLVYAEPIIALFFGSGFVGASAFLGVLGVGVALLTPLYVLGFAFLGAGRALVILRILIVTLIVAIALSLVLIPIYGAIGVAWAKVIVGIMSIGALLVALRRVFGAHLFIRTSVVSIVAGSVLFVGLSFFPSSLVSLLIGAPLGILLYIGTLWLLGALTAFDREKPSKESV